MEDQQQNKNLGFGLNPLPKDNRDFKLRGIFSTMDISEIPDADFIIAEPLEIKEQYDSDMCAAFAATAVSEDQEGVILSSEYLFAKGKKLSGDWKGWGLDLRTISKAITKFGSIKKEFSPYNLKSEDRDFIANWKNWSLELDNNAKLYRKKSYFAVGNLGKDTFDSFRIALWQHKKKKCSILTGVIWEKEWTSAEEGIIPKSFSAELFGHAIKIFGQKNINGEIYLTAQLSNGENIGDKGIFYFPREVINREFNFGAYMFIDLDPENIKKISWSWQIKLLDIIKKIKIWH